LNVLTYRTGINRNDTSFKTSFPFVQTPWAGTHNCDCSDDDQTSARTNDIPATTNMRTIAPPKSEMGMTTPDIFLSTFPNPSSGVNIVKYRVAVPSTVTIMVMDAQGRKVGELVNEKQEAGVFTVEWDTSKLAPGVYFITALKDGSKKHAVQLVKN